MDQTQLSATLNQSVEAHNFSGVISIRQHGHVLYERASGYADRNNWIENSIQTRFGIASGTKFFTALAIGKLIADQNLAFTTKLKECLPLDLPAYSPEITIRHLLTHTSGIPDYYDEGKITDFEAFTVSRPWYELKELNDYLAVFPDEPMKFQPGERFSYCNSGYILLGLVIEALTGVKYREYVTQAVFTPAGMQHSGFFAFNQLPEKTALGYIDEPGGWRTNIYSLPIVGGSDGGAYTTLMDLENLWTAFWGEKILPKELVEIFASPYVRAETEGEHVDYGHGLWLRAEPGGRQEVYITGCDAGVSLKSSVDRQRDLQITVISNTTHGAWPILREINALSLPSPHTTGVRHGKIEYQESKYISPQVLQQFFQQEEWSDFLDLDEVQLHLDTALYLVTAWCGEELVGYARLEGDGRIWVDISDVLVKLSYRDRGIGTELVKRLVAYIEKLDPYFIQVTPIGEREVHLYTKFGFEEMPFDRRMQRITTKLARKAAEVREKKQKGTTPA